MRLLRCGDDGKLSLTEDLFGPDIPPYAILSHTWGPDDDEVTFKDFADRTTEKKEGYRKLEFCAKQATLYSIQYFWVDTCCINRADAAELQASINSMFRWYRDSARCFVYLSDVSASDDLGKDGDDSHAPWKLAFKNSRWFSRGWTLQELLAPASVQFFSKEGNLLGDKGSLETEIHSITQIPIQALQRGPPFDQFNVEQRLIWAEKRETTREEDWAYCILGLFGVFMPLLYGEGKANAVRRLRKQISDTPKRQEWLRKLYVCPSRDRKDRNPQRVEGTCKWFTSHQIFRSWQENNAASLLWVSADPGCGKSVLAKYLADEVLPSTMTRATCYFFFKEDFEDQRSSIFSLCSLLHQIFDQDPVSFSTEILMTLEEKGDTLLKAFRDLWDILISAAASSKRKEIVCIFDALDECEASGRHQLIEAISKFYSGKTTRPTLKVIVTSRPYLDIHRGFFLLERELPTIHLSGEDEEEVDKISREIDLVVGSRVVDLGERLGLLQEEQRVLREELTRNSNRTYLWVYLIFDILNNSIIDGLDDLSSIVKAIPKTVDAAYDRILSKSPNAVQARKLLHIIVAAARPLTLQEMAVALAIKPHHRSVTDLKLGPEARIRDNIRQYCGLFVMIVDSKIYLLHQTAREFLVPPLFHELPIAPNQHDAKLQWKFSLHPKESSRILAEICIQRLSLSDFNLRDFKKGQHNYNYERNLLGYAAQFWADHFRGSDWKKSDSEVKKALSYFNPKFPAAIAWFEMYQTLSSRRVPQSLIPLVVASFLGVSLVVQQLLDTGADTSAKDHNGLTALHWAAEHGHEAVVQQLLDAGANTSVKDNGGLTALYRAAENGHEAVVQQLLVAGADTSVKDNGGLTALYRAAENGHEAVVQRLINAGADASVKDNRGLTALYQASKNGYELVVQRLLDAGADTSTKDHNGLTALHCAAERGHEAVVQQLLDAGANTSVKDDGGLTAFHRAADNGHEAVVQQLLDAGADTTVEDELGYTALHWASTNGHEAVVQQLLNAGANTNAKDIDGYTALHWASVHGYEAVVQRLLDAGAIWKSPNF